MVVELRAFDPIELAGLGWLDWVGFGTVDLKARLVRWWVDGLGGEINEWMSNETFKCVPLLLLRASCASLLFVAND